MKDETSGYHLFLEPEGALNEELSALVRALAQEHGGPVFAPHVTLLGPIEMTEDRVVAGAEQLARDLTPFPVTLTALAGESAFFRALYLEVIPTPELLEARNRATEIFAIPDAEPYHPHLSLFYGTIDQERREQMKALIALTQKPVFLASSIHIYRTEGPTERWQKVAEVPFLGS